MFKKIACLIYFYALVSFADDSVVKSSMALILSSDGVERIPDFVQETQKPTAIFSSDPFSLQGPGYVSLVHLSDKHLKICGVSHKKKCKRAVVRMYTTGVPGPGRYNRAGGYGAPLSAGRETLKTVGLHVDNAAVLQSVDIPSWKYKLSLSDFSNPHYQVQADFSNAGAGNYSTILVVEFALLL